MYSISEANNIYRLSIALQIYNKLNKRVKEKNTKSSLQHDSTFSRYINKMVYRIRENAFNSDFNQIKKIENEERKKWKTKIFLQC